MRWMLGVGEREREREREREGGREANEKKVTGCNSGLTPHGAFSSLFLPMAVDQKTNFGGGMQCWAVHDATT